jgi:hypothetical protein
MKHNLIVKRFLIAFLFCFSAVIVKSQDPGDPGSNPGGTPTGWVPIDTGLAALLSAGIGYGVKKAFDYKKNQRRN